MGRVKTEKRLKEGNQNQAAGKVVFDSFSSFEWFSSSSIVIFFQNFYCPFVWSRPLVGCWTNITLAMANIGGMHLNIESSTNNVIDGRHLIINQWWQMCLLFWSGFDLSLVKKTVLLNITANSPDIKFGGLWFYTEKHRAPSPPPQVLTSGFV